LFPSDSAEQFDPELTAEGLVADHQGRGNELLDSLQKTVLLLLVKNSKFETNSNIETVGY
jgi:hypothetical protein